MPSITPSPWFDDNLEEAAEFYTSVFPNSRIEGVNRTTDAGPGEPVGQFRARVDRRTRIGPARRRTKAMYGTRKIVFAELERAAR